MAVNWSDPLYQELLRQNTGFDPSQAPSGFDPFNYEANSYENQLRNKVNRHHDQWKVGATNQANAYDIPGVEPWIDSGGDRFYLRGLGTDGRARYASPSSGMTRSVSYDQSLRDGAEARWQQSMREQVADGIGGNPGDYVPPEGWIDPDNSPYPNIPAGGNPIDYLRPPPGYAAPGQGGSDNAFDHLTPIGGQPSQGAPGNGDPFSPGSGSAPVDWTPGGGTVGDPSSDAGDQFEMLKVQRDRQMLRDQVGRNRWNQHMEGLQDRQNQVSDDPFMPSQPGGGGNSGEPLPDYVLRDGITPGMTNQEIVDLARQAGIYNDNEINLLRQHSENNPNFSSSKYWGSLGRDELLGTLDRDRSPAWGGTLEKTFNWMWQNPSLTNPGAAPPGYAQPVTAMSADPFLPQQAGGNI